MYRRLPFALVILSLLWAPCASGQTASRYAYVGAGIGASLVDTQVQDISQDNFTLDGNEFAYKFLAGYRFRMLAVEGSYRNFGKVQGEGAATGTYVQPTSWDVFAVGNLTVLMVDVFAKAGVSFTKLETSLDDLDSTDFSWGLGVGAYFGPVGGRAEFESIAVEGSDSLSMLSASLLFRF